MLSYLFFNSKDMTLIPGVYISTLNYQYSHITRPLGGWLPSVTFGHRHNKTHPHASNRNVLSDRCQPSYPPHSERSEISRSSLNPLATPIAVGLDHKEKFRKKESLAAHTTVPSVTSCLVDWTIVEFTFVYHRQRFLTPPFPRASISHAYETRTRAQCR